MFVQYLAEAVNHIAAEPRSPTATVRSPRASVAGPPSKGFVVA